MCWESRDFQLLGEKKLCHAHVRVDAALRWTTDTLCTEGVGITTCSNDAGYEVAVPNDGTSRASASTSRRPGSRPREKTARHTNIFPQPPS